MNTGWALIWAIVRAVCILTAAIGFGWQLLQGNNEAATLWGVILLLWKQG